MQPLMFQCKDAGISEDKFMYVLRIPLHGENMVELLCTVKDLENLHAVVREQLVEISMEKMKDEDANGSGV